MDIYLKQKLEFKNSSVKSMAICNEANFKHWGFQQQKNNNNLKWNK